MFKGHISVLINQISISLQIFFFLNDEKRERLEWSGDVRAPRGLELLIGEISAEVT